MTSRILFYWLHSALLEFMKPIRYTPWAVWMAVTLSGFAEVPAVRDAMTHDQLVLTLRQAEQNDPMKKMKAAKGEDPSAKNRPKSLLSESDIISYGGLATLVPKRAILQMPESWAGRLKIEAGAKIVSWSDFYAQNRGWITTVEISREQAEGGQPLAEETKKMMKKSRNLVVATYQGGPISLLAAKPASKPATVPPTEPVGEPKTPQP